MKRVDLATFDARAFDRGRPAIIEAIWILVQALLVSSWLPGSWHRSVLLRLFGAKIGRGVRIKPGVRVKFPWRLSIGNDCWIGENVWIDNLADVTMGSNCCISQGAYLCTGNHDWSKGSFDLKVGPIVIADAAWIAARATVAPGVSIDEGAVLGIGSVALKSLEGWKIYSGNPATAVKDRNLLLGPDL